MISNYCSSEEVFQSLSEHLYVHRVLNNGGKLHLGLPRNHSSLIDIHCVLGMSYEVLIKDFFISDSVTLFIPYSSSLD